MNLPFATPEFPGVPALFKAVPEDFRVDELPAYLPCGEGEHLFLRIEKRGRDTREVVREIARTLKVGERDVGVAGQKDRHAVTTQWISVHLAAASVEEALSLQGEGFRVLEASHHRNKLRIGHLRGNRFQIVLRGVTGSGLDELRTIAAALTLVGLPNYYGAQRFGRRGDNAEVGRAILLGSDDPRARRALRDPRQRRFLVSAFQSEVFNRVLARRLQEGTWARPSAGDVLERLESGGLFVCEDPATDLERVRSFECSVTGPVPGSKVRPTPSGAPAALEAEALAATGVEEAHLSASPDARGTRRALRLPIEVGVEGGEGEEAHLSFELPAGSYATSVLREFTKSSLAHEG